ncbi:MAG: Holliday junction branch migration protein RuvA [Syntrophomonadaceae bacterium]|nr:Holliday junction branch migration protein RuvA [Syntrophomonadaceae bacterium]MDH7498159.1 Holliday junction branch migration protein RuvA [Syntrophomonadaceae bacterium]
MISFVRGTLVEASAESAVVEVNGMGLELTIPAGTLARLPQVGTQVMLHTHLQVLESGWKLYGFLHRSELRLFRLLMEVSGMGGRTCLGVVGSMPPEDFYRAVLAGDEKTLTRIPGIGKKSAQRLIFELQGRLQRAGVPLPGVAVSGSSPQWEETLLALEALGYERSEVYPLLVDLSGRGELGACAEDNLRLVLRMKAEAHSAQRKRG